MSAHGASRAIGALVFVLFASAAQAAEPVPARPVDVFVAGGPDAMTRLENAVGVTGRSLRWKWIGSLDVADVVRRPADAPRAARAWIDCSRADRVRIYFADWTTERFLLRDVPLPDGWNEIALEAVGQVLDSSLATLDAGDTTSLSRAEMASALGEKPAPPAPPAPWGATIGAFYGVEAFAPEHPVEQGPGLIATVGPREGRWRWSGWVSAQYRLPETIDTGLVGVRLDTLALRGGARLEHPVGRRVDVALLAGPGLDVVHIAPREGSSAEATLTSDRFSTSVTAGVAIACAARLGAAITVWGALSVDLDLVNRRYAVDVDGAHQTVMTPWWIRPGVMVGVAWP
jgi:hypothetical protein